MPQKRNPYALAVIRTQAGIAAGDLAAMLVTLHTGSARTDHFHLLNGSVPRALEEARRRRAARRGGGRGHDDRRRPLGARRPRGLHRRRRRGRRARGRGGPRLPHRAPRGRPGGARSGGGGAAAGRAHARSACRRPREASVGRAVAISAEALADALDPAACVAARLQTGSAAPAEVAAMIAELPRPDRRGARGQRGGAGAGDSGGGRPPGAGAGSGAVTISVRTLRA